MEALHRVGDICGKSVFAKKDNDSVDVDVY